MGSRITAHIRSNVIGYVALVVAVSGTAYAAGKINGKQIRQNSIPANRLTKSARTSLQGQQGPPGHNGATNVVVRTSVIPSGSGSIIGEAECDPGERALSGGAARSDGGITAGDAILASYPETATGFHLAPAGATPMAWASGIFVSSTTSLTFYVICASP
jgi:hypothetical protein